MACHELTEDFLRGFSGGDTVYRHWLKRFNYSEGVKAMADVGGAHWLIDAIASHQNNAKLRKGMLADFQIWEINVKAGKAVLTVKADTNTPPAVTQRIPFTDFPLPYLKLYLENGLLSLPSER